MEFTAQDVKKALSEEDKDYFNEKFYEEIWYLYEEHGVGLEFEVPGIGTAKILEHKTGKGSGELEDPAYDYVAVWLNYVVFELNGRFFRITGKWDSWDADGPTDLEEVESVKKTITVWEKKLDY